MVSVLVYLNVIVMTRILVSPDLTIVTLLLTIQMFADVFHAREIAPVVVKTHVFVIRIFRNVYSILAKAAVSMVPIVLAEIVGV
jgi:hypothetical protein